MTAAGMPYLLLIPGPRAAALQILGISIAFATQLVNGGCWNCERSTIGLLR